MILVSSCLVGIPCRYDGKGKKNEIICKYLEEKQLGKDYILVCPEVAANLPIPRAPGEIMEGNAQGVLAGTHKVMGKSGEDYTSAFLQGAQEVCALAREKKAAVAILKENSPSCGSHFVYDGTFSGHKKPGKGLTALLLSKMGVQIYSEETLDDLQKECEKQNID